MRRIIGIVGVSGSGKMLVWKHLVERYGFTRLSFTGPAKDMLVKGLGLPADRIDGARRDVKSELLCWNSGRDLTRSLINDWGRRHVGPDFWRNLWHRNAMALDGDIVADDVLNTDEADVIRSLGGVIWKVYRPGLNAANQTAESAQRGIEEDHLLANATTIPDLLASVDALMVQQKET